ncbi:hypothetical protein AAKU55_001772 [Oxalobacteraceae bacterium GrIS 1.11]
MFAMVKLTSLRRLHIWIACFAILINALAPSISHAIAALQVQSLSAEICRADGVPAIASEQAAPAPLKNGKMAMGEHCGYCLAHAASFALPPTALAALGLFGGHAALPFLFYRSPQPLTAWSAARPRGPPRLA